MNWEVYLGILGRKERERERALVYGAVSLGPGLGPASSGDAATTPGRHWSLMRWPFLSRTHLCRGRESRRPWCEGRKGDGIATSSRGRREVFQFFPDVNTGLWDLAEKT